MFKKIQYFLHLLSLLPKLSALDKRCDDLLRQLRESQSECNTERTWVSALKLQVESLEDEKILLESSNKSLRNRLQESNKYGQLDIPKPKEEIEERLKTLTKSASIALIEYLKLDTYLLVQNLAQVTNKDNVSEVIAYRDGAIGRNQALIERLSKVA